VRELGACPPYSTSRRNCDDVRSLPHRQRFNRFPLHHAYVTPSLPMKKTRWTSNTWACIFSYLPRIHIRKHNATQNRMNHRSIQQQVAPSGLSTKYW